MKDEVMIAARLCGVCGLVHVCAEDVDRARASGVGVIRVTGAVVVHPVSGVG